MDTQKLWQTFYQSGKVEDYLRYRSACTMQKKEGSTDASNDRRTDHSGHGRRR